MGADGAQEEWRYHIRDLEDAGGLEKGKGSPGAGIEEGAAPCSRKYLGRGATQGGWEGRGHGHHCSAGAGAGGREGCLLLGPLTLAGGASSRVGGWPLLFLGLPESPTRARGLCWELGLGYNSLHHYPGFFPSHATSSSWKLSLLLRLLRKASSPPHPLRALRPPYHSLRMSV